MMPNDAMLTVYFLMWFLLVGMSILFLCSGLDDLFIDAYYWSRHVWRFWKTRHYQPLTYAQLADKPEQPIAILVPCWHEANVISTMLKHNCYSIDYSNYVFFVGVYPNDPETMAEVQAMAALLPHVQCVVGDMPGPTNKAANLNQIYKALTLYEKTRPEPFKIIVFHDSKDVIHPLSFKLYNYLIPRKDMIQIPVFPLSVGYSKFTHWLYADEFSENHTKDIIVRESIKAHVPSAGVGTAFYRPMLDKLRDVTANGPFSTDSLTEDYRTSLEICLQRFNQVFVTQQILRMQWRKRRFFRRGYVQKPCKETIATRALFPMEYRKAVRQKARWIMGIVFQEWEHSRWPKAWPVRYSLSHDRKAFITHFINGLGYVVFLFWLIYTLLTANNPHYPSLQEQFNMHPWVWWMVLAVTCVMVERLIQRVIAVRRIYGWWPALLSIPRAFYGNILNLHAVIRAYRIYFTSLNLAPVASATTTAPTSGLAWDKTEHHFPGSHILTPYRRRLGDLLQEQGHITPEELNRAVIVQQRTGERLGQVLCRLGYLTPATLLQLLAAQYALTCFPLSQLEEAYARCAPILPKKIARWLSKQGVKPIAMDARAQHLTLGIEDPTNELLIEKVISYLVPYQAQFVLIDPDS